jgi:hypothetical protein
MRQKGSPVAATYAHKARITSQIWAKFRNSPLLVPQRKLKLSRIFALPLGLAHFLAPAFNAPREKGKIRLVTRTLVPLRKTYWPA